MSRIHRQGLAAIICVIIWGVAIIGVGICVAFAGNTALPMLPITVGLLMVCGAADMASSAFRQSILLSAASDEMRGRLQGVFIVAVATAGG